MSDSDKLMVISLCLLIVLVVGGLSIARNRIEADAREDSQRSAIYTLQAVTQRRPRCVWVTPNSGMCTAFGTPAKPK